MELLKVLSFFICLVYLTQINALVENDEDIQIIQGLLGQPSSQITQNLRNDDLKLRFRNVDEGDIQIIQDATTTTMKSNVLKKNKHFKQEQQPIIINEEDSLILDNILNQQTTTTTLSPLNIKARINRLPNTVTSQENPLVFDEDDTQVLENILNTQTTLQKLLNNEKRRLKQTAPIQVQIQDESVQQPRRPIDERRNNKLQKTIVDLSKPTNVIVPIESTSGNKLSESDLQIIQNLLQNTPIPATTTTTKLPDLLRKSKQNSRISPAIVQSQQSGSRNQDFLRKSAKVDKSLTNLARDNLIQETIDNITTTTTTPPTTTTAKELYCLGYTSGDQLPHPIEGKKFIVCQSSTEYVVMNCPATLVFNRFMNRCDRTSGEPPKACLSSPCKNGGRCTDTETYGFMCECPDGFSGNTCERGNDPCFTNPCSPNGACNSLDIFKLKNLQYYCLCDGGNSYGLDCDRNTFENPCVSHHSESYYPSELSQSLFIHCESDIMNIKSCHQPLVWSQKYLTCVTLDELNSANEEDDKIHTHQHEQSHDNDSFEFI